MQCALAIIATIGAFVTGATQPREDPHIVPRLAFEPSLGPLESNLASPAMTKRGFPLDGSRRVPSAPESAADFDRVRDAVAVVVEALDLRWSFEREVYALPAGGDPLTSKPILSKKETVPLTVLPSPHDIVWAMAEAKTLVPDRQMWAPESIRPKIQGKVAASCVYLPRHPDRQATDYRTPRPQGIPAKSVPTTVGMGDPLVASGRLVNGLGVIAADMNGVYDSVIGQASVVLATRNIWYYRIEVANPHKGKRRGGRMGVLDDASVLEDWCFPIMDANGQSRGDDDPRRAERGYPYENLVTTRLVDFPIQAQQAPVVLPTGWTSDGERSGPAHETMKGLFDGTESIVLPQRLIDAAGGVVIVRKAASWRPLAQDIVIDADTKNHAGILGVYVSQIVTDERLIDAMSELCGEAPPTGDARAALVEAVSKARERP